MRSWLRENAIAAVIAAGALYVVAWLGLYDWAWNDYGNEARPAFDALVQGHLLSFLQLAPGYGGSLVMRAPFVLATRLWAGSELAIYRASAAPCLAATGVLGVWLVAQMRGLGRTGLARGLALFLCVANPIVLPALEIGHPEELLGGVLCIAAVLTAMRGRPIWAGLLLGLAIANKDWAVLATGPVLIALPDRRIRAMVTAVGAGGLVLAPLVLAGLGVFSSGSGSTSGGFLGQVQSSATSASVVFNPWQIWWFFGGHVHTLRVAGQVIPGHRWDHRVEPGWVATYAHPLIVAISGPLTLLCVALRRRRTGPVHEPLVLLMLVLFLRCMLDPWNMSYYELPFLFTLVVWEALTFARPPMLSLSATFATWFVFQWAVPTHGFSPDQQSLLYLAFALPALIALVLALYAPGASERLSLRWRQRDPLPSPA